MQMLLFPPCRYFFALCLLSLLGAAQQIQVPGYYQSCVSVTLSWQATTAPYTLSILSSEGTTLATLDPTYNTYASWNVPLPAGTSFSFSWQDASGLSTYVLVLLHHLAQIQVIIAISVSNVQTVSQGGSNSCFDSGSDQQSSPQQQPQEPGYSVRIVATTTVCLGAL